MKNEKLYNMVFLKIYDAYINKAERKGRTKEEVNEIIYWLLGYNDQTLEKALNENLTVKSFFNDAPSLNINAKNIKGVICGVRVVDIEDPLMQRIRYLDKLIDELAKGKSIDKILSR